MGRGALTLFPVCAGGRGTGRRSRPSLRLGRRPPRRGDGRRAPRAGCAAHPVPRKRPCIFPHNSSPRPPAAPCKPQAYGPQAKPPLWGSFRRASPAPPAAHPPPPAGPPPPPPGPPPPRRPLHPAGIRAAGHAAPVGQVSAVFARRPCGPPRRPCGPPRRPCGPPRRPSHNPRPTPQIPLKYPMKQSLQKSKYYTNPLRNPRHL